MSGSIPDASRNTRGDVIELTAIEALLRLGLSILVGMAIGLEREWHEKAAGFRTITLVTVGSALFTLSGDALGLSPTDRARIAAGVVTGIGFLGAGTILRERGEVIGLTTAATVWAACALGIASAFGQYVLVVTGTAVVLVVLVVFPKLEVAETANDVRRYQVTASYSEDAYAAFVQRFKGSGLRLRRKSVTREGGQLTAVWDAFGRPEAHKAAVRAFLDDPTVSRVEVV